MKVLDYYFRHQGLGVTAKQIGLGTSCGHQAWKLLVKHICPERTPEEVEMFASAMSLEEYIYDEAKLSSDEDRPTSGEDRAMKIAELRELLEKRLAESTEEMVEFRYAQ